MRKIKDREFGEASSELSKMMLELYNARKIDSPENSFNENFAQHWQNLSHKMKIQALACVLPESFMYGVDEVTELYFLRYFNELGKKYRKPNHPQLMRHDHFHDALALKEKQVFDLPYEEDKKPGKKMRNITDEDVNEVLQRLFFNSDESPETDVYEFYPERLRKNTSENFYRVFMSDYNKKLFSMVEFVKETLKKNAREEGGEDEALRVIKFRCDRRLCHSKFSLILEEFNKERVRDGKDEISGFQFRQLIPGLFLEPKCKDAFSCVCGECFSLRNTLSRGIFKILRKKVKNIQLLIFSFCFK